MACNRPGDLHANDRGRLQQLLLGRQPVDAGCQHGLHRRWDLNARHRLRQTIGSRRADQQAGFHQGADALFQEERIALRPRNQQLCERRQAGSSPRRACRSSWALTGGSGSSRSWV